MKQSQSGFTLTEVLVSTFLLGICATCYLMSTIQGERTVAMAAGHMEAMHIARDQLEQVTAKPYDEITSFSPIQIDDTYICTCAVTASAGFTDTKDVSMNVSWNDPGGNTISEISLTTSVTQGLHE